MKYTEELLLKVSNEAYNKGDVKFDIIPENCALLVIDMQEPELKVLRKGFAKVMDLEGILKVIK